MFFKVKGWGTGVDSKEGPEEEKERKNKQRIVDSLRPLSEKAPISSWVLHPHEFVELLL